MVGSFARIPPGLARTVQISTVVFSPAVVKLWNPTQLGASSRPQNIRLRVQAYDAFGNPVTPSKKNPITVNIYGAPTGAISPTSASITSGDSVKLSYNGQFLPNPITVEVYTANDGVGGQAIGVTQTPAEVQNSHCLWLQRFCHSFDCGGEPD